jgi:hypothetical protein
MGHHLSAIITSSSIDVTTATSFDLPVFVENGFTIIALDAEHSDYWQQQLGLMDHSTPEMILDCVVTHHFAQQIGATRYAIIETDYFGGVGDQMAVVYENQHMLMPPTHGGINAALRLLGVQRRGDVDEFDTIHLGRYRDFSAYFEKYRDSTV